MEAFMPLIVLGSLIYWFGVLFSTVSLLYDRPWIVEDSMVLTEGKRTGDIVHVKVRYLMVKQILIRSARQVLLWPWRSVKWMGRIMDDDPKTKSERYEREHPKG